MTTDPTRCPNCDSWDTRREMTQHYNNDHIECVRTCSECPTQYVVGYGNPQIVSSTTMEDTDAH